MFYFTDSSGFAAGSTEAMLIFLQNSVMLEGREKLSAALVPRSQQYPACSAALAL